MNKPKAQTLDRVLAEAQDIAQSVGQQMTSGHALLALFTVANQAEAVLKERGVDEDTILGTMRHVEAEPPEVLASLLRQAEEMASLLEASKVTCLHFLMAICKDRTSVAHRLLKASGMDLGKLRMEIISRTTGSKRSRTVRPAEVAQQLAVSEVSRQVTVARHSSHPGVSSWHPAPARTGAGTTISSVSVTEAPAPFALEPREHPWLTKLGRNLSDAANWHGPEMLVGRTKELDTIIDILGKLRSNNPLLVGEPGVGKTAIVEGLAKLAANQPQMVPALQGKVIVEIDLSRLTAGTSLRGAFAERITGIRDEVARARGKIIVFIDEIHQIINAGQGGEGSEDAANSLKSALARGEFPCIGATTNDELKRFIESDPAFERRFTTVVIPEPSVPDTVTILEGVQEMYRKHHRVTYDTGSLRAAAQLSSRYISERFLPDKAINLIDLAGSRARRRGVRKITPVEIAQVVAELAQVPAEKLLMSDGDRLIGMEDIIARRIVGHRDVLAKVANVIRRNYAGFSARRPIGSFLFLGPTGVGKTEMVKALAEFLFQSKDAMVRLDMSEYMESHSVSRLIGAPPGYVGYEAGGQLTEAVRRKPYQLILLDEIEKAHREVLQVLLQVLDEGRLTDSRGRTVDFTNAVIVMTSNLGSQHFAKNSQAARIGFTEAPGAPGTEADQVAARVLATAKGAFPPELWNRIEERLVFMRLTREELVTIAGLEAAASSAALAKEKDIRFHVTKPVIEFVLDHGGFEPEMGARPLRQTLQRLVEARIAEAILRGTLKPGQDAEITLAPDGQTIVVEARERPGVPAPEPAMTPAPPPPAS